MEIFVSGSNIRLFSLALNLFFTRDNAGVYSKLISGLAYQKVYIVISFPALPFTARLHASSYMALSVMIIVVLFLFFYFVVDQTVFW